MIVRHRAFAWAILCLLAAPVSAQTVDAIYAGPVAADSADNGEDGEDYPAIAEAPRPDHLRVAWTNFVGAAVAGDGGREARAGGRIDAFLNLPLPLWQGLSISAQPEFIYGASVNGTAGTLLPVNTALAFPASNADAFDLSVSVVQQVGRVRIQVGKINMITASSRTPIIGGGGRQGFQHLMLAAPVTLLTPPSIIGALVTLPVGPLVANFGIWDPNSAARRSGFDKRPFADGVNGMVSLTLPVRPRGLPGFQTVTFMTTSQRSIDLANIPELLLPDGPKTVGTRRGGWFVRYAFQQKLWIDAADPARSIAVFGQVGLWDGNPTPGDHVANIGIIGPAPFKARPSDRLGLGLFRFRFSRTLTDALAPLLDVRAEQGMEAFYTLPVGRRLAFTANAQLVDPAIRDSGTAVFLGLRLAAEF